jgi:hypothetical protein
MVYTKFRAFLHYVHKYSPSSVLCPVKLDSAFRCTRSNVESHSTALSAVTGPMSSQARQRFPLYQVTCRVTFDSASAVTVPMSNHDRQLFSMFHSNVESRSTVLSAVTGPMSRHARQRFRCSNSNVESHSTALPGVPSPMPSSYRRVILHCKLIFPKLVLSNGCSLTLNIRDLM